MYRQMSINVNGGVGGGVGGGIGGGITEAAATPVPTGRLAFGAASKLSAASQTRDGPARLLS